MVDLTLPVYPPGDGCIRQVSCTQLHDRLNVIILRFVDTTGQDEYWAIHSSGSVGCLRGSSSAAIRRGPKTREREPKLRTEDTKPVCLSHTAVNRGSLPKIPVRKQFSCRREFLEDSDGLITSKVVYVIPYLTSFCARAEHQSTRLPGTMVRDV